MPPLPLQACKFIEENLAIRVDTLGKDALINCAKTAMSSKIIGGADEDFFSKMAVDAMLAVKTTTPEGKARCAALDRVQGFKDFSNFFSKMAVDAMLAV